MSPSNALAILDSALSFDKLTTIKLCEKIIADETEEVLRVVIL